MSEFKPGDVAHVRGEYPSGRSTCEFSEIGLRSIDGFWQLLGEVVHDDHVAEVRRLVVIDAEDSEQVERLGRLLWHMSPGANWGVPCGEPYAKFFEDTEAALREFANPTPPKPDEPMGLGAVVEDASGHLWVRAKTTTTSAHWNRAHGQMGGKRLSWSAIDVVRVLSEGVTP